MTTASPAGPDLVADRGLDLQFAAGLEPEADVVEHAAGDPAVLGDAGDGRKAHAGRAADDVENRRHGIDPAHRIDVSLEVVRG